MVLRKVMPADPGGLFLMTGPVSSYILEEG